MTTRPLRRLTRALLLVTLWLGGGALWQDAAAQGRIVFDATTHAFGTIPEGEQATHAFTFRNTGDAPLRLTDVRPSCGCTTPEWPREAVAPGETGTITVVYDSEGRPGPFHKSVVVLSDGEPSQVNLQIEGHVEPERLTGGDLQGNLLVDAEVADFHFVEQGRALHHTFRLQNNGERPIRIQEARYDHQYLQAAVPPRPLFPGDVIDFTVHLTPADLEVGATFDYPVVLVTDDETQPIKSLRLTGRLIAPTP